MKANHDRFRIFLFTLFGILTLWWFYSFFYLHAQNVHQNLLWAACYQALALSGGLYGLYVAKRWGGFKSILGRALSFFAIGLLLQTFGQSVFSFYNLVSGVDVPYPSLADIGFFGSIPVYIYAAIEMARASGAGFSLASFRGRLYAIVIPGVLLVVSYILFLKGYAVDSGQLIKTILDFGYPLGQAVYISVAIVTFALSIKFLGGMMREKIFFILTALVMQYAADFNFLYQANHGTWINGGYGDYLYTISYFLMAFGLVWFGELHGAIEQHAAV